MGVCLPGSDATPEDYQSIAVHFENEKNHFMAGKFFLLSEQFVRVGMACRSLGPPPWFRKHSKCMSGWVRLVACRVQLHGSESTQSVCQGGYGLSFAGSTSMVRKALKVFVVVGTACRSQVPPPWCRKHSKCLCSSV